MRKILFVFLSLMSFVPTAFADDVFDADITNGCASDILGFTENVSIEPVFEPQSITCSTGQYLPVNTANCETCPAESTCAAGTYTFNETKSQGIVYNEQFTQTKPKGCAENILGIAAAVSFEPVFELKNIQCASGYYLAANNATCSQCTSGSYCPGGTYTFSETDDQGAIACPTGYDYNTALGKTSVTQCQIHCEGGTYIKAAGVPPSSYASDGLLLLLDGYENTQNGNDPNTNVWYDLSPRQNNANLIGAVQYDSVNHGYIFDANSKYAVTQNSLGLSGAAIGTLEFAGVWYGKGSSQVNGLFTLGNGGQNYSITGAVDRFCSVNATVGMSLVPTAGVPFTITYISSNGAISGFRVMLNGQQVANSSSGAQLSLPGDPLQIGRYWQYAGNNRSFNGIINSVRVYDRVLTPQEIQDNYEVDTLRFKSDFGTEQCVNVGAGYWAAASTVTYGSVGTRTACPAGTTTVGYGHGADSANDCGRVLHIGDHVVYSRRNKETPHALHARFGDSNEMFYISLSSTNHNMSRLHLSVDGNQYTVYDDSLFYGERDFDTGQPVSQ